MRRRSTVGGALEMFSLPLPLHSTPITLAESSMADRLQTGRSGLQMSSLPGTVIPRWRTSSSSRVGVSKASAFHFVSRTVCSPYPTLNVRQRSFSSRRCTDLEQSSAAYHICSVTSRLLLSLEDILLRTLLLVITVVVPAKWHCHWHVNRSYLLTFFCEQDPQTTDLLNVNSGISAAQM